VVDANIGANKANMYVKRSQKYSVSVDRDSNLKSTLDITWQHSGTSSSWPGGDYIDYVRIYVPAGAVLKEAHNFEDDNLEISEEGGKTVFGGKVAVVHNRKKSVSISYELPRSLGLNLNKGQYELLWQKQAGIVEEPVQVTFHTPLFLKIDQASKDAVIDKSNAAVWDNIQANDTTFSVKTTQR
jgi:hypothetical protein